MTPFAFGQSVALRIKTAAGSSRDMTNSSFLNEWWNAPKGTGAGSYTDKWYNPWTKNTDPLAKGEGSLMNAGRAAMGVGAAAGTAAAGIAAAPALSSALPQVGRGLGTAYKAYNTATTSPATHAAKFLTQSASPFTKTVATTTAKATGLGLTGATMYGTYNDAADATAQSAMRLAQQAGVNDQKVLDEVGQRARGQMLPMAYRSLAPGWMGGDTTPVGNQIRKDIGTVAYHNVAPALLRPSQAAADMSLGQRAIFGAVGNPVSAVTSAFVTPRPSAQQMWNNVPAQQRQQMGTNIMRATTLPGSENSALAQSMGHVFQPAVQHQQQQLQTVGQQFANNFNFSGATP
jgi:hypothetical protein